MHNLSSSYSPANFVKSRTTKANLISAPTYSFTQKTTTVSYPWPPSITGIERIALSAQGDLQRVLSAFFARPISIAVVFEETHWQRSPDAAPELLKVPSPEAIASASPSTPIVQTRRVNLQCSGKVVCEATSTVRMTSANTAQLFLVDKFAIGQTFRRLEKLPAFDLLAVGLGPRNQREGDLTHSKAESLSSGNRELWRRYQLVVPEFDCDIVEVFPDRNMFVHGEAWLDDRLVFGVPCPNSLQVKAEITPLTWRSGSSNFLFICGFFLLLIYELTLIAVGGRFNVGQ